MARGLSNPKQIMLLACLLWQSHCYLPEAALYHPLVQPHLNNYQVFSSSGPSSWQQDDEEEPKNTTLNCFWSSNCIHKKGSFLLQLPFQLIIRINNLHGSVKQRNSSPPSQQTLSRSRWHLSPLLSLPLLQEAATKNASTISSSK